MAENNNTKRRSFWRLEKEVSIVIGIDVVLFVLTLLAGGFGVGWLKVLLGILTIAVSALGCGFLYLVGELNRRRSLWMVTAFACTLLCTLVSLIVGYP